MKRIISGGGEGRKKAMGVRCSPNNKEKPRATFKVFAKPQ